MKTTELLKANDKSAVIQEQQILLSEYRKYYGKKSSALLVQGRGYDISKQFNVNFDLTCTKHKFDKLDYPLNYCNSYVKLIRENESKYQFLCEGLIRTYPLKNLLDKYFKFCEDNLPKYMLDCMMTDKKSNVQQPIYKKYEIEAYDDKSKVAGLVTFIIPFVDNSFANDFAKRLSDAFQVYGYDLATHTVVDDEKVEPASIDNKPIKLLYVTFEARFFRKDPKLTKWLYHLTTLEAAKNVIAKGFIPKSKHQYFKYRDRMYFFTEQGPNQMALFLDFHERIPMVLFRIETSKLQAWEPYKSGKVLFYVNPKYIMSNVEDDPIAIYTHDTIPFTLADSRCIFFDVDNEMFTAGKETTTNEILRM